MQVLEIIALRKDGLRGQAFVVFEDVQAATAALQAEQGFTFFGKDLKLAYAKEKSDRIAKRDGTFVPRAKRRKRDDESSAVAAAASAAAAGDTSSGADTGMETADAGAAAAPTGDAPVAAATATTPQQQPTHILFAENLPSECNEMMLAMLFRQVRTVQYYSLWLLPVLILRHFFVTLSIDRLRQSCSILYRSYHYTHKHAWCCVDSWLDIQYAGFKEVRIPRAGLAFIEFDTEPHATLALERLNGFKLTTTDSLKLTYGKA